jgi:hydroxymethylpyrimidine/phosphomethylpyrimidine kinase / thiaminase
MLVHMRKWPNYSNIRTKRLPSRLLAAKSHAYASILAATEVVFSIIRESSMHMGYCAEWGITEDELNSTPESPALTAYGAFLIDTGMQGTATYFVDVAR